MITAIYNQTVQDSVMFNLLAEDVAGAQLLPSIIDPGVTDLVISGTTGADVIRVYPGAGGQLSVKIGRRRLGQFNPTGRIVVYGGAGNDVIQISSSIARAAWLFGEAGNDKLSSGTGFDILLGGDGRDTLDGGFGRNLLIGGNHADILDGPLGDNNQNGGRNQSIGRKDIHNGSRGDNIQIGGTTDHDAHDSALAAILAEWSIGDNSANSYDLCLAHLQGPSGGANGSFFLNSMTVHDDLAIDRLNGGSGQNWYFAHEFGPSGRDSVHRRKPSESTYPV